jgi:murein DD-endopeptidase MepM/ murein hydrolase activator NlpD
MKNIKNYITKKKVLEFLDAKGFYIVLVLCIGIITTTAYIVTKSNLQSYVDTTPFEDISKSVQKPSANSPKAVVNTLQTEKKDNQKVNPKKSDASKTQPNTPVKNNTKDTPKAASKTTDEKKKNITMSFPVVGDIIQDYSKNYLVYSKTLEQWTTHGGLDIFSDRGTPVKAVADGVIENIFNDEKYGITIVVDHGSGLKSKYCNLSTDSMVKKGLQVKKGDVISGIGNTAIFESGDQPHLHFEVLLENANVNPKNYIK